MFEFSVIKHMNKKNSIKKYKRRNPAYFLAYLLILIIKELEIGMEQGKR